jgi:hypothetical protein
MPERQLLALDNAKDLGQPALATAHKVGFGANFIMAVWEMEACIKRTHPDFQSVQWLPRPGGPTCDPKGGNFGGVFGHSTQVASALAADRGGNDTIGLFRATLVDIEETVGDDTAVDAMWNLNPTIVNASFTTTWSDGRRIDEEVYARKSFVFTAAGNDADAGYAQCWAYNAFCVGGYNKNTVGNYQDDSLWAGTTYRNRDDGREMPQIVGPAFASQLARYQGSGYEPGVGTSFASPAVAGLAGLLVAEHPFVVWERPALMRAILMASAQAHPILDPNGGKRIPDFDDNYDDRVGVGAPNGARANAIVKNGQYFYDARFEPVDLGSYRTISVAPNRRVRVVMAWDQCPGYSGLSPELNVDFDMVVEREVPPLGGVPPERHFNLSYVDNWEVIEFFTPMGGRYTLKVFAPRWSPCSAENGTRRARLALAWTTETAGGIFDSGVLSEDMR